MCSSWKPFWILVSSDPLATGHDDVVGGLPAELLGGLERERLRTLGVERPHVDVDERPLVQPGELRAQPVDVVVVAVDRDDVAAVDRGGDDLALLEVRRDEHVAAQPGVRRVRGDRVREVAGRRARRDLEAELERLAQRDRDDPVLERVRRVARVVLDPDLAEAELGREAVGPHERREPGAEVDRGVGRAPAAGRRSATATSGPAAIFSRLVARGDRVVVVRHFERAEAPLARVDRRGLVLTTALSTAQPMHVGPEILDHFFSPFRSTRSRAPRAEGRSSAVSSVRHWHLARPVRRFRISFVLVAAASKGLSLSRSG